MAREVDSPGGKIKLPEIGSKYTKLVIVLVSALLLGMMIFGTGGMGKRKGGRFEYPYRARYREDGKDRKMDSAELKALVEHIKVLYNRTPMPASAIEAQLTGKHAVEEGYVLSDSEGAERIRSVMKAHGFMQFNSRSYKQFQRKYDLKTSELEELLEELVAWQSRREALNNTLNASRSELQELYRATNDKYTVLYKVFSAENYLDKVPEPDDKAVKTEYTRLRSLPREQNGRTGESVKNPFEVSAVIAFSSYDKARESLAFEIESFSAEEVTDKMEKRDKERIRRWVAQPLFVTRDVNGHVMASLRYANKYNLAGLKPTPPPDGADEKQMKAYEKKLDGLIDINELVEELYDIELDKRRKLMDRMRKEIAEQSEAAKQSTDDDGYPLLGYRYAKTLGFPELATSDKDNWKKLLPTKYLLEYKLRKYYDDRAPAAAREALDRFIYEINHAVKAAEDSGALAYEKPPKGADPHKNIEIERANMKKRVEFFKRWFAENRKYHPAIEYVVTDMLSYDEADTLYGHGAAGGEPFVLSPKQPRTGALRLIIAERNLMPETGVKVAGAERKSWKQALRAFSSQPMAGGVKAAWTYMLAGTRNEFSYEPGFYKPLDKVRNKIVLSLKAKETPKLAADDARKEYRRLSEEGKPLDPDKWFRFTESLGVSRNDEMEKALRKEGVNPETGSAMEVVALGRMRSKLMRETLEQRLLREMARAKADLAVGDLIKPFELTYFLSGSDRVGRGDKHVVLAYLARRESPEQYASRRNPGNPLPEGYYMLGDNDWNTYGLIQIAVFAVKASTGSAGGYVSFFWPQMTSVVERFRAWGEGKNRKDPLLVFLKSVASDRPLEYILQYYQMGMLKDAWLPAFEPAKAIQEECLQEVNRNWKEYFDDKFSISVENIAKKK